MTATPDQVGTPSSVHETSALRSASEGRAGGDETMIDRVALVRRGLQLNYLTIAYNSVEALVSLVAGVLAGSARWSALVWTA